MDVIKTKIGNYVKGEPMAITMTTHCGRQYTYKGVIEGTRTCMGKEYLVMRSSSDGNIYDVSLDGNVKIMTGKEALEAKES